MKIDLSGIWQFKLDQNMEGIDKAYFAMPSFDDEITLPGTTSEAKKGEKNNNKDTGYLTDHYSFEGYAWYATEFKVDAENVGKLAKLTLERTRMTRVWLDGNEVDGGYTKNDRSFCAPHYYFLGKMLEAGTHRLVILVDNCKDNYDIAGGHMTSPDTQTNWNGIVGEISIDFSCDIYVLGQNAYPSIEDNSVDIELELAEEFLDEVNRRNFAYTTNDITADVRVRLTRMKLGAKNSYSIENIGTTRDYKEIPLTSSLRNKDGYFSANVTFKEEVKLWDEYNPNVYVLEVTLKRDKTVLAHTELTTGFRRFAHDGLKLLCNGEEIFLRGTHDALIYPLTGYAPMDMDSWVRTLGISKDYGFNHYRYHTSVPPMAALKAANYLGIYMQPELPLWGSLYDEEDENFNAKEDKYVTEEGFRILDAFGDEPSFFGMSMGNELWGSKERIDALVAGFKAYDDRHLYTQGSNNHQFVPSVQEHDDFFAGVRFDKDRLFRGSYAMCDAPLGFVQTTRPDATYSFDGMILPEVTAGASGSGKKTITIQYGTGTKEVEADENGGVFIPEIPVVSHEVGQYEMMPDFSTIEKYTGVMSPENLNVFKERLELKGLLPYADEFFKASAKLAMDCYKRELEAAHRSKYLSGYQILDFKDYTGQGTALVGMMDPFLDSKGIMTQAQIREFNCDAVLLPEISDFVVESGAKIDVPLKLRYYRPEGLDNITVTATWLSKDNPLKNVNMVSFKLDTKVTGRGLFELGEIGVTAPNVADNELYSLVIRIKDTDISNGYEFFVYKPVEMSQAKNDAVVTSDYKEMISSLESGKNVLYFPKYLNPGRKIEGDYCSDFWCYTMFRQISESVNKPVANGTMGLSIDTGHAALSGFATRDYTTPQWYEAVEHIPLTVLDGIKHIPIKPIVRMVDNIERNNDLGLIYELAVDKGNLLVCMADLTEIIGDRPHFIHLYNSLLNYISSERFAPADEVSVEVVQMLFG